jgi:hypothetical protein
VATSDGGARWHVVTAPDFRLFNVGGDLLNQASRVSGVVITSRRDGWLYGPGLYATHNGGARWRRISLGGDIRPSLGGGVVAMAASAGTAWAVVSPDPFHGKPDELYRSPVGRNAWARVGAMTAQAATFAVSGKAAWFGPSTVGTRTYLWATTDGVHWHHYPFRCPPGYGLASIAAASASHVVFLCTGESFTGHTYKEVLRSVNGGRTEHLVGPAPLGGVGGVIAVPPHRSKVITLADEYFVYRSADGGKTWKTVLVNLSGGSWMSLSFVSKTAGWAVQNGTSTGPGHQLLRTSNAGATWHRVRF